MRNPVQNLEGSGPADSADPPLTEAVALVNFEVAPPAEPGQPKPQLPEPGEEFVGFELVDNLGRGAFGRVYLARQVSLASRLVALKISSDIFDETQTLAELQHTNIVPIYSAHRAGRLQAVCMPYFGATTLADVFIDLQRHASLPTSGRHFVSTLELRRGSTRHDGSSHSNSAEGSGQHRPLPQSAELPAGAKPTFELLSGFTFVEAVLWLGGRLADGLAHAHDRGVVHRDLKPANVLLADDGRPMILDFNLAGRANESLRGRGGTVPYMAPEQLRNCSSERQEPIDGRADIYALGLILYELLAGRPAYPRRSGKASDVAAEMIADRRLVPAPIRKFNHAVTPAVEAIVRKCLAFDPDQRYRSARALQEDLDHQLAHEPLRHIPEPSWRERLGKWSLRHPRLSSSGSIAALAGLVVMLMGYAIYHHRADADRQQAIANTRAAELELITLLRDTEQVRTDLIRAPEGDMQTAAESAARSALARYGLPHNSNWTAQPLVAALAAPDIGRLRERLGELLFLVAQSGIDHVGLGPARPESVKDLVRLSDAAAAVTGERSRGWWLQRARILQVAGDQPGVIAARASAQVAPADSLTDQYLVAVEHYQSGRFGEAINLLERLSRSSPQDFGVWHLLGVCYYKLQRDEEAGACFNACVGLSPKNYRPYANRGFAYFRQNKREAAAADFETAMQLGDTNPDVVFRRAQCLVTLRKTKEADQLLSQLVDEGKYRQRALLARAETRRRAGNKAGADADRQAGLALKPTTAADFNARGRARRDTDAEAALLDFQRAEQLNPWFTSALQNQADVLANILNRPEESLQALERLLARSPDQPQALAGRAVMLARLNRIDEAVRDAKVVLARFDQPLLRYQVAGVYALSADRPGHLKEAIRLLNSAIRQKANLAEQLISDPELRPIHGRPEFKKLLEGTAALRIQD
ncbi:MAG: protein kinase [Gemmataceae bacterium]|nr:protein kinase [Gemmataceae bacterium]